MLACIAQVWPTIAAWFGLPAYESLRQPLPLLMMKHDVRPCLPSLRLQGHAQIPDPDLGGACFLLQCNARVTQPACSLLPLCACVWCRTPTGVGRPCTKQVASEL